MIRLLALGCVVAALLLAGSAAWAEDPPGPPGAEAGAPPVAPPVLTEGSDQGGKALGEALYGPTTPEMLDRALRADTFRTGGPPWQGQVRLRYRYRSTTEDEQADDNDVYGYLKAKYRDEMLPGWSGSFHGRLSLDVGSFGNTDGYYAFDSVTDTYAHRLNGRLYHAYANYRFQRGLIEEVRVGRQYSDVGEYLHYDGARATTRPLGRGWWQLSAFAGVPAHLFESSVEGDVTAGGSVSGRPWRQGDVRLDYTFVQDESSYYGREQNHLWNATVNQRIGMNTLVRGTYQHLNEDPRLLRILVDSFVPAPDVTIRATAHTVFTEQEEAVYDFDYYYAVTLDLQPYWMGNLSVSKGIGRYFVVEGGASARQLYDQADEGTYNREFGQYFVTVGSSDWLLRDLELAISGEWWNSDDDIWTVTFDVDWRPSYAWRLRLGTDYAAYRYDIYADQERQNVFGGFARVTWSPCPRWQFDLRLRVDDDQLYGTWTTLDAGLSFDF